MMAFLVCAGTLQAQEMVENPEFLSWSQFKKGTTIRMKSVSTADGKSSEVIVASTLLEISPDKVVIETESTEIRKGKDFKTKPEKRDIPQKTQLPRALSRTDFALGKPPGTTADGTEVLKIGDTELKTVWYQYRAEVDGTKVEGKRWVSSQVPGNIVKDEITTTGKFSSKTVLELLEIKKP